MILDINSFPIVTFVMGLERFTVLRNVYIYIHRYGSHVFYIDMASDLDNVC